MPPPVINYDQIATSLSSGVMSWCLLFSQFQAVKVWMMWCPLVFLLKLVEERVVIARILFLIIQYIIGKLTVEKI